MFYQNIIHPISYCNLDESKCLMFFNTFLVDNDLSFIEGMFFSYPFYLHNVALDISLLVCTYLVLVLALLLFYTTYSLEMSLIMIESKWYTKVLLTMQQNISIHISDTFNDFIVISKEIGLELQNIYSSENLLNHWYQLK